MVVTLELEASMCSQPGKPRSTESLDQVIVTATFSGYRDGDQFSVVCHVVLGEKVHTSSDDALLKQREYVLTSRQDPLLPSSHDDLHLMMHCI